MQHSDSAPAGDDLTMVVVHFRDEPAVAHLIATSRDWSVQPSRIVVVDNSGDLDPTALPADVIVVDPSGNGGYGVAVNYAWSSVLGRPRTGRLLVCTQDATMAPDALEMLLAAAFRRDRVGIVAPALAYRDDPSTIFSLGGSLSKHGVVTHLAADRPVAEADGHATEIEVDWCDGAILLIDNQVMDELNGFDPAYFLYVEEVDFAFRAKLRGWSTIVTRRAQAWQQPGNYRPYLRYRNSIYFTRKFRGKVKQWPWARLLFEDTARMLLGRHQFAPLQAATGALHGLFGHMPRPSWAPPIADSPLDRGTAPCPSSGNLQSS